MRQGLRALVAGVAIAALLGSCASATETRTQAPRTEVDKAIAKCVGSVMVGALLGGIIGNNSGRGNAGRGALIGAAAGGAVCAVLLKVASEKDRILAEQRQAVAEGGFQAASYTGSDGMERIVRTHTEDAPTEVAGAGRICRYADSEIEVQGTGTAPLGRQLYCRDGNGDWAPADAAGV